jgi:hypothetical protein
MLLKQYYLGCLAHASYRIADAATGIAIVVDPQRHIEQYLHDTAPHGWHITYVFLTHFHTDFLAGHIELRERVGATICLGARAQADFAFTPFAHGDTLTCGPVRLTILETPGRWLWVRWSLVWDAKPGAYRIMSRATDEVGRVEPQTPRSNCMRKNCSAIVGTDVTVQEDTAGWRLRAGPPAPARAPAALTR